MFDKVLDADRAAATTGAWNPASDQPAATAGIPLERLEAQICELAGHLAAATCRFLVLLGDFDAQQGWASWEMTSCAAWLSWKCQMSSGTAREHVRVARALRELPVTRGEFAVGRLSYAKVRALTRIATPATEASLAELAAPMTANQLERFARAHRQVSSVDDTTARIRRRLAFRIDDDGTLSGTFHLPPLAGAVLLKALRSAVALDHPAPAFDEHHPADPKHSDPADPEHSDPADPEHSDPVGSGHPGVSAETPGSIPPLAPTSTSLADALLTVAEAYLAGQAASADDPEPYQVILHVGTDALPPARSTDQPANHPVDQAADPLSTTTNVSAETPASSKAPPPQPPPQRQPGPRGPGDPADPARCHVEDGPALSLSTAQMIACSATVSWMLHDSAGKLLDLGRRRRRPNAALRRAVRDRDKCRCRFPGCESRRVDLHHIQYWSNGGRTSLDNLVSLCRYHHQLVHDRGYLIAASRNGPFTFFRPDGSLVPSCPPLPPPAGTIAECHDAGITPETIIPAWYGDRLDLDHAIYICFKNAENAARVAEHARQHPNDPPLVPAARPAPPIPADPPDPPGPATDYQPVQRKWVINSEDWMPSLRRLHGAN